MKIQHFLLHYAIICLYISYYTANLIFIEYRYNMLIFIVLPLLSVEYDVDSTNGVVKMRQPEKLNGNIDIISRKLICPYKRIIGIYSIKNST